jgi:hypothetical protein
VTSHTPIPHIFTRNNRFSGTIHVKYPTRRGQNTLNGTLYICFYKVQKYAYDVNVGPKSKAYSFQLQLGSLSSPAPVSR